MGRVIGKVVDYNGVNGSIVDKDKVKYIFTSKDLLDETVKVDDIVFFEKEVFKTVEVEINLARFIAKK